MDGLIAYVLAKKYVSDTLQNATNENHEKVFQFVNELPNTGESGVTYIVLTSGNNQVICSEYDWTNNLYRQISSVSIDLSDYWQKNEIEVATYTEFINEMNA